MAVSPIAEAFVAVRPDTTGFSSKLVTGVKNEIAKATQQNVKVGLVLAPGVRTKIKGDIQKLATNLRLDPKLTTGAKGAIRSEIATKIGILPLPLMPTLAKGAKASLQAELRGLGLTTTVATTGAPVGTPTTPPPAGGTGGGGGRNVRTLTEEQVKLKAKAQAVANLAKVETALNKVEASGIGVTSQDRQEELRLKAVRSALTVTTNALGDATAKLTVRETRGLESTVRRLRKEEETLTRQIQTRQSQAKQAADREKTTLTDDKSKDKQATQDLKDRARATAEFQKVQRAANDVVTKGGITTKESVRLGRQASASESVEKKIRDQLTSSTLKLNAAERARLENLLKSQQAQTGRLRGDQGAAAARERQAAEDLKNQTAASRKEAALKTRQTQALAGVTTRLAIAETRAVATGADLRAIEGELSALRSVETRITNALKNETLALSAAQQAELQGNLATVRSRRAAVLAIQDQAKAAADQAKSQGQARRGAIATSASFAGLRGAVLAASTPFILATVAVTAFGKAIASAANLEQQLAVFRATTGATAAGMEAVSEAAVALGKDLTLPSVTAGDAANAMVELAKAGLSTRDSIAAAKGVLQLATAAAIGNEEAVQLAASALNAFGLAGDQAVHVADVLANSANAAQGSIVDMGTALQQSAAVARQSGISLEDTASLLTLLARNGLRGSDAGTSLRTALIRLTRPTKEANAAIQSLGLNIRDAQGNIRPDVFAEFGRVTADLPKQVRDSVAALVFGQDAIRAVAILSREGADGLATMQGAIDKSGTAAELAAARMSGLRGAVEGLTSNLSTLGTQAGQVLVPGLTLVVKTLNAMLKPLAIVGAAFALRVVVLGSLRAALSLAAKAQAAYTAVIAASIPVEKAAQATTASGIILVGKAAQADAAATVARVSRTRALGTALLRGIGGGSAAAGAGVLAVGALAAGIGLLISRDSELEEATKAVGRAMDEATAATERHQTALDAVAASTTAIRELEKQRAQAFVALASAQADAQVNPAREGTLDEIRQTNALGEARNTLREIEEKLADEQEKRAQAGQESENAAREATAASRERAAAILNEIAVITQQVQLDARRRSRTLPGGEGPRTAQEVTGQVVDTVTAALEKQAEQAGRTDVVLQRNIEHVKELFANLAIEGRRPTLAQVNLILNNKEFNATLDQILARKNVATVDLQITNLELLTQGLESTLKLVATEGLANALPGTRDAVLKMVQELNKLGPKGSEVVVRNAKALGELFATNFSDSAKNALDAAIEAVESAQERLRDTIEQSHKAVEDSVRQAVSTIRSLGEQLGSDFAQLVDAGPIGRQIDALQAKLDAMRGKSNMADLREEQRLAKLALAEKQASIAVVGPVTPAIQKDIDNFLQPERERVRKANENIAIAQTETRLDAAQKASDDLKEATSKGIDDAIAQWEAGKITFAQLNKKLVGLLKKDAPAYVTAGKTLGIAFQREFGSHLSTLQRQLKALKDAAAAGINIRITQETISEPAAVQAEGRRNIRQAQDTLADAIAKRSKAEARLRAAQKTNKLIQTQINIARRQSRLKTKPKSTVASKGPGGPPGIGDLPGQRSDN